MTHRQGQDLQGSYMDGIVVKISEHYKPPPRINLPITYAQRLSLNKQIQDNMPNYNFVLETNVKQQIGALKNARNCIVQRSQERCELIKEERHKRDERRQKEIEVKEKEILNSEIVNTSTLTQTVTNSVFIAPETSQTYTSNPGILVPTQVTLYGNILTPIPLKNSVNNINCKPTDRSPFNISDFEADTSSPFDNMELKTLNDMEELAQVLKKDEPVHATTVSQMYSMYSPVQSVTSNCCSEYGSYLRSDGGSGITQTSNIYTFPPKMSPYNQQGYSRTNGYNFSPDSVSFDKPANVSYPFTSFVSDHNTIQNTRYNTKSVPDIMKALETELENHHISNTHSEHSSYVKNHSVIKRKCSTPIMAKSKDNLDDPYGTLPKNLQDLCTSISLMGFPLPRVARACKVLGDDHKKVISKFRCSGCLFS